MLIHLEMHFGTYGDLELQYLKWLEQHWKQYLSRLSTYYRKVDQKRFGF